MELKPAICPNCGGKLSVDSSKEAAVCDYCNTPFIVEKAITLYNNTYVTNIENFHADNVTFTNDFEHDKLAKAGEDFIRLKEYEKAAKAFSTLSNNYPGDYRGWWGTARALSKDFSDTEITNATLSEITALYEKACVVAPDEDKGFISESFKNYTTAVNNSFGKHKTLTLAKLQQITNDLNSKRSNIQKQITNLEEERKTHGCLPMIATFLSPSILVVMIMFLTYNPNFSFWDFLGIFIGSSIFAIIVGLFLTGLLAVLYLEPKKREVDAKIAYLKNQIRNLEKAAEEKRLHIGKEFELKTGKKLNGSFSTSVSQSKK